MRRRQHPRGWRGPNSCFNVLAPTGMQREVEVLLACVRAPSAPGGQSLEVLLDRELDWTVVVRMALGHGVSPIVAERLLGTPAGAIPNDLRAALDVHLQDNRARNALLGAALIELLDALHASNVTALSFKGPTLAALTTGDYTTRRAGDLDMLVRWSDLEAARVTLEALDYRECTEFAIGRPMTSSEHRGYLRYQCEYAFLRKRDGVYVEPHWAVAPATMAIDLDYPRMWQRASRVDVAGRSVLTLGLADLLPVLCIHGSKHGWTRLQWIADVAALVDKFSDFELAGILKEMRSRGLLRMTLLGLELARRVLAKPLPDGVRAAVADDRGLARVSQVIIGQLFSTDVSASNAPLTRLRRDMRERAVDRINCMLRTTFTPTAQHYRMCSLPSSLSWFYVPLKLGHDYVALPLHVAWKRRRRGNRRISAGNAP
jgi:putative nucleotidyltransferase-like protein